MADAFAAADEGDGLHRDFLDSGDLDPMLDPYYGMSGAAGPSTGNYGQLACPYAPLAIQRPLIRGTEEVDAEGDDGDIGDYANEGEHSTSPVAQTSHEDPYAMDQLDARMCPLGFFRRPLTRFHKDLLWRIQTGFSRAR
jgi:hypothetical protein